ncbi:CBM35 domain-containing protein [Hamadaea tsunoensis]|uniref:CBM35 domain-containing protein n=1 Tax=Hamadaea tsunoensis TaxID=53368 RepID=UPI0003FA1E9E|nr:CBM35 domain-containing protein [Hamadaea tsunoensis]
MNRRAFGATVMAACLALASAFAGLTVGAPAYAATTQQTFITFYGWYDNTPPGGDIAYPKIHSTAGGKGTYADPITFATSTAELPAGKIVYVPRVKKYFIMEDGCEECSADWSGQGPNGGPNLRHIDLWLGGQGGSAFDAIDCEDALTHYNADGTPVLEPVIVDPPNNETVDNTPLFNTGTGACYGGAQPNVTVGRYKNASTGTCLEDPGNSSTSGVALKLAACTGSAAQTFQFHGAFLVINNLCADNVSGTIKMTTCTGGPNQQWSVNPNLTISDIQTGGKCFRASGTSVLAGSCSGTAAQWNFTAAATDDFSVATSPAAGGVTGGGTLTATVTTAVTAGSALPVALAVTGAPAGVTASVSPASVTAGGSATLTVTVAASAAAGTYPLSVTGSSGSLSHSAAYALTIGSSGGGGTVRYEAENATVSQGAVATNHTGYSGSGFVDYTNVTGSFVEFAVTAASAGNATFVLAYANGTTVNRPMDVAVNGTVVAAGAAFPATATWDTWATKSFTVPLAAGSNTVRLTATTASGGPNVDYADVTPVTAPPPVTRYEAENATISQGVLETTHTGFSGTGYVNCDNVAGSYVQFAVDAAAAGPAGLRIRYSNGTTANRPASITVDGTVVAASQAFAVTTDWDTWADVNLTISLTAGAHTVRITGTTATGPANIDFIEIG